MSDDRTDSDRGAHSTAFMVLLLLIAAGGTFMFARQRFAACLRVWGQDPQVHLLAARAARLTRDYAETERLLRRCRDLGGVPEAIDLENALARAQRGELRGIEAYLWTFVERQYSDTPWILEALAQGYMQTCRLPAALGCFQRLLKASPNNPDFLVWAGSVQAILNAKANGQLAWIPSLEAATMIENELDRIDILYGLIDPRVLIEA